MGIKRYDNDLQLRKGFAEILRLLGKEKENRLSFGIVCIWYPATFIVHSVCLLVLPTSFL